MTEAQYREFAVREVDAEERTIAGLAVPYGETVEVGGYRERVEKGAFGAPENVKLFYGHNHRNGGLPIGRVTEIRDTDEGLFIKAHLSKTTEGENVYTLLRDGVLDKFSVGFRPVESRQEDDVVVRTKADLFEVSVVPMPAYAGASIAEVREDSATNQTKENDVTMSENDNIALEVAELREAFSDLERKTVANTATAEVKEAPLFREAGEALKGLAANDEKAQAEFRAYTGATTTDANTQPAWLNRPIQLVQENRNVLNLFSKGVLPAQGMTVNYPVFGSKSGDVAVQAAEGDDLTYLELVTSDATAPVKTYGGYSSLSRQAIERSDAAYLTKVLEMQAISYAKVTNSAVRTALTGASGVNTATVAANDEAASWIGTVITASAAIAGNSRGLTAEFMVVSPTTFAKLATVVDGSGRPVFVINGDGSNSIGSVNVRGLSANIAGLPVVVDPSLTGEFAYVASSQAVTVLESAGAPFRLADENIINLTKDFSLYGYMAVTVNDPKGIVKVTATDAA